MEKEGTRQKDIKKEEEEMSKYINQINSLKNEIDFLKNQLNEEKGGKVNVQKVLGELIQGIEEEYELKESISELGRLQRINLEKISLKRKELMQVEEGKKKEAIEFDLQALEDIYQENEEIRREMQDRMCLMEGERAIWIKNVPKKVEEIEKLPHTPIHLKSSMNRNNIKKENIEPKKLDFKEIYNKEKNQYKYKKKNEDNLINIDNLDKSSNFQRNSQFLRKSLSEVNPNFNPSEVSSSLHGIIEWPKPDTPDKIKKQLQESGCKNQHQNKKQSEEIEEVETEKKNQQISKSPAKKSKRERYVGTLNRNIKEQNSIQQKWKGIKTEVYKSKDKLEIRRSRNKIRGLKKKTQNCLNENREVYSQIDDIRKKNQNRNTFTRPNSSKRREGAGWGSIHIENEARRLNCLLNRLTSENVRRSRRNSARRSRRSSRDYGNVPLESFQTSAQKTELEQEEEIHPFDTNMNLTLREPFESRRASTKDKNYNLEINSRLSTKFTDKCAKLAKDVNINLPCLEEDKENSMMNDSMNIEFIDIGQLEEQEMASYHKKLQKARERMREFKKKLSMMELFLEKYEKRALKKGSAEIFKAVKILINEERKQKYNLTQAERRTMECIIDFARRFEARWEKENNAEKRSRSYGMKKAKMDSIKGDIFYKKKTNYKNKWKS